MKRYLLITALITIVLSQASIAQEEIYLTFEFMRVDDGQHLAYMETEGFWEKIHQQLANSDAIIGWDLWSLLPGGVDQGYQYLVVTVFDDPVKMMKHLSWDELMAAAKKAYPEMTEDGISKKISGSVKSRDLAVRLYLDRIALTDDEFGMDIGTVVAINLMQAEAGKGADYVKAEQEVYLPIHQKAIKAGRMEHWELWRVISPRGSNACASHITVDMYRDYKQFLDPPPFAPNTFSSEQIAAYQEGLKTRDMKWTYMGTLLKKVRKNTD